MILMRMSLEKAEAYLLGQAVLEIPYSNEPFHPPDISIPASPKSGDLVILIMAVQYMVSKNGEVELLNDKKKLPCGVVWAGLLSA
jgi:hypothetical protein